ncbi:unnamed protein product, partial [Polarella glacialis]
SDSNEKGRGIRKVQKLPISGEVVPAKPGNCRFDSLDACRLSACQAADDSGRSRGLLGTKPPGASQQSVSSCWRT